MKLTLDEAKALGYVPDPKSNVWFKTGSLPPRPQPEQTDVPRVSRQVQRTPENGLRYLVRVTSFRKRLIDPDNLCAKYFVDALRYAEIIPDDTAAIMAYTITQQKAKEERTEIEIIPL